jgi:hypothetical protein
MLLQFFTATATISTPAPAPSGRHTAATSKPQQQHLHKWLQHVLPALLQALLTCARLLAGTAAAGSSSSILRSVKDQAAADKVSLHNEWTHFADGSSADVGSEEARRQVDQLAGCYFLCCSRCRFLQQGLGPACLPSVITNEAGCMLMFDWCCTRAVDKVHCL